MLDSRAFYEPFGDYRLEPTGDYTDQGYTGHLGNNSGSNDIGLIYMNARFYVPGIGRFASADTIVPDPGNPQAFNRYSYVENSPINFSDPSGHCGADSSEDLTDQCDILRGNLHQTYEVNILGVWTLAEMGILELALRDLEEGLGGLVYFVDAFRGTNLSRERVWQSQNDDAAITTLLGDATFFNQSFSLGQDFGRWAVLHEFGHVWDYRGINGWDNSLGIVDTALELWTKPSNAMHLFSEQGRVSSYADDGVEEDFSESWASYFFGGSWENMTNPIGGARPRVQAGSSREAFIDLQVGNWKVTVDNINFAINNPAAWGMNH